jgi:hypothetical protein
MSDSALDGFLRQHLDPNGKASLHRVFEAFKREPHTEGWRKTRFLAAILKSSQVRVTKERGRTIVHGVALPKESRAQAVFRPARSTPQPLPMCACGRVLHPCYQSPPWLCEDCSALRWEALHVQGAHKLHKYAHKIGGKRGKRIDRRSDYGARIDRSGQGGRVHRPDVASVVSSALL